jgi:putative ABC transport system substrate-binding protein
MDRRDFVGVVIAHLTLGVASAPLAAEAQQAGKVYRLGYLSAPTRESVENVLQAFLRALRELGWVEGKNLIIEYRWADGNVEQLPGLAAELVRRNVDVLVAPAGSAAMAAKNATSSIPIVMVFANDPVEIGLVANLRRPGGNITGTSFTPGPEIFGRQLQILKETVPRASRVAILSNPADPTLSLRTMRELDTAAESLRIRLQHVGARGPEEFDAAFGAMARDRADALLVLSGSPFVVHRTRVAELALKDRLPTMYNFREGVEAGGLMAYAVNMGAFVERAASYVDKILKGRKPADLPIEQPSKFELVINLKTAKALGLTIPQSVLLSADSLIE